MPTRLVLEMLEDRTLLAADIWNVNVSPANVRLGVADYGNLGALPISQNYNSYTGVSSYFLPTNSAMNDNLLAIRYTPDRSVGPPQNMEGIAGGVPREGWGVGDTISGNWGGVVGDEQTNLGTPSFTRDLVSARSTVTAGGIFQVTQSFASSASPNAYEDTVTIRNTSSSAVNARFLRTIHWYIEPAYSDEYVTVSGSTSPGVWSFRNTGSSTGANYNPLTVVSGSNNDSTIQGNTGVTLVLTLGMLDPGQEITFSLFFGVAGTQAAALGAINALGLGGYSLASPYPMGYTGTGQTPSFFFGFDYPVVQAVTVTESGGSTNVTPGGTSDNYTLVLNSQPAGNVTISISAGSQLAVTPSTLIFTSANWNTARTVNVTGTSSSASTGGNVITQTASSSDPLYDGIPVVNVTVNITPPTAIFSETGGSTQVTEGGGTDTYTVVLNSRPSGTVTITAVTDDQVTVIPASISFTASNWNRPQTFTVTAVDDAFVEGVPTSTILHTATSTDANYNQLSLTPVTVDILDNDAPGLVLNPRGLLAILEGKSRSYTAMLSAAPTSEVTVTLMPTDSQLQLSATTLLFDANNWNLPQTITVTAADDSVAVGNRSLAISHAITSTDAAYANVGSSDLAVTVVDDESSLVIRTNGARSQTSLLFSTKTVQAVVAGRSTFYPVPTQVVVLANGAETIRLLNPTMPVFVISEAGGAKLAIDGKATANAFAVDANSLVANGSSIGLQGVNAVTLIGKGAGDLLAVRAVPAFSVLFQGGAGQEQLIGPDRANIWSITGSGAGTLDGVISFNAVENLTGGSGDDLFHFKAAGAVVGAIDGRAGNNTLDLSLKTASITANLQTGTITGTRGFRNIATFRAGSSTQDKLIGANVSSTWNITGLNAGIVGGLNFLGFENLTGGNMDDTFVFADGQGLTGKIDGGIGADTLDYSAYSSSVFIDLRTGKARGIAGFLRMEHFVGGAGTDSFTGANRVSTWRLTGNGAGDLTGGITFQNFENLTGGSLADTFALLAAGDWLGLLDGGAGFDTLLSDAGGVYVLTGLSMGTLNGRNFKAIENRR